MHVTNDHRYKRAGLDLDRGWTDLQAIASGQFLVWGTPTNFISLNSANHHMKHSSILYVDAVNLLIK